MNGPARKDKKDLTLREIRIENQTNANSTKKRITASDTLFYISVGLEKSVTEQPNATDTDTSIHGGGLSETYIIPPHGRGSERKRK